MTWRKGVPGGRSGGIALLLTMGLSLFLLLAMVLLIFGPRLGRGLASLVGLGSVFAILWNILRWPVSAGLLTGALALVYYCAPDCGAGVEVDYAWGDLCGPGDPARLARLFALRQPLWIV
jgi:Virulence factor BrkB